MSNAIDNKSIVRDLRNDTVDVQSRHIDWAATLGEDLEGWEAFEAVDCDECDRVTVLTTAMGGDEHRYIEPEFENEDGEVVENECMGHLYFEGPMMNSFYPCPFNDTDEAARAIASLPLCVIVLQDGETGFALTGGGMDLSWEICDAYIRCGFLPPFQFCCLPDMAGKDRESRTQLILTACQRTADVRGSQAEYRRIELKQMATKYKNPNAA